jgi:hypothetical protein
MTETKTPFDHRPDPLLGAALRAALTSGESPGFAARVMAAAQVRRAHPVEHLLARWARRGIAVAAVAALAAGLVIGRAHQTAEPSVADADPGAMIADVQAVDASILFAAGTGR